MIAHSGDQCISDAASKKQSSGTTVSESMLEKYENERRSEKVRTREGAVTKDIHENDLADTNVP